MSHIYFNPNPSRKIVGDCVIRAIVRLTGMSWEQTYLEVMRRGFELHDMPSANEVWGSYLRSIGYRRFGIPDTCPDCYTISDFCEDNPHGEFILATGSHVVAVAEGDYYDTWDSGNEVPVFYWRKE